MGGGRVVNAINLRVVAGVEAPQHENAQELELDELVVTEQGTVHRLPLLQFVCRDPLGRRFVLVLTGGNASHIAALVSAVNLRNHGMACAQRKGR